MFLRQLVSEQRKPCATNLADILHRHAHTVHLAASSCCCIFSFISPWRKWYVRIVFFAGMPGGPPMMGGMGGPPAMMGRGGPPMPGHGGPPPMPGQGGPMGPGGNMNPHGRPSTVLELSNMVVEHELRDPQTYQVRTSLNVAFNKS